MAGLFSKPKYPAVNTTPITSDTPEVAEAARAEAERLRRAKGFRSTIKTGPGGVTDTAPTLRTTLG